MAYKRGFQTGAKVSINNPMTQAKGQRKPHSGKLISLYLR